MLRYILILLAALGTTACATPEQRAAQMRAEMDRMIQVYGPACGRLGYAENSDQWRNCVLQLSMKEEMERYGRHPSYYAGVGRSHWRFGGAWGPW